MTYSIQFPADWRYRDRKRGFRTVAAGVYAVPHELKEAVAAMALDARAARRIGNAPPARAELKISAARKTRTPKTKSLGIAPENKSAMD